jgi:hypothetical protein
MTQKSLHWDGVSIGDANTLIENASDGIGWRISNILYESPFIDRMSRALWNGTGNRGVLRSWANELEVTGVVTPVSINTGAAIVYGLYYENNTAPVTKAIATPTNDTRNDLVVVRRNWITQEARIYVITGSEGEGVPVLVQSPAPSGMGIYDIPLASVSITVGGAITVTDLREYIMIPTTFEADAFGTAELANDSIDWTQRATRSKTIFLGAGDLQPNVNAGRFAYSGIYYFPQVGPPTWGAGAADEKGWNTTGISDDMMGLYATFCRPADYAGGNITSYIWWVNNVAVAANFSIVSAYQYWHGVSSWGGGYTASALQSTPVTSIGAVSDVFRSTGITLSYSHLNQAAGIPPPYPPDTMIYYYAAFFNMYDAVADASIMGIEFNYIGFV